jgi:hypothetical protein
MSRAFEKNSDLLFAPLGCRWMPANITKNTHTSRPHALSPNALYAVATFAASALRHYVNERTHIEHREEKEYLRRRLWFTCGGEQLHWSMGGIALAFPYSTRATARTMHINHKVHAHRPKSARQAREKSARSCAQWNRIISMRRSFTIICIYVWCSEWREHFKLFC